MIKHTKLQKAFALNIQPGMRSPDTSKSAFLAVINHIPLPDHIPLGKYQNLVLYNVKEN